ncbi:MAG: aspartyl-tRNA amidotransferase subunit B [Candidatus Parcubacteria bacterium]|nr:MAG: aspartyl-tRNA amidotransferase subunit B [Candidatus Parcubacteria bacterium]
MEILEQIKNDLKQAQLNKDNLVLDTLRLLLSEIHNYEIKKRATNEEITEDDIIQIIQKEIKKRKEAREMFLNGNRIDLADEALKEINVLSKYAPSNLSQEEILKIIADLKQKGFTDFNSLMKEIMKNFKGKVDGKEVKELIEKSLQ